MLCTLHPSQDQIGWLVSLCRLGSTLDFGYYRWLSLKKQREKPLLHFALAVIFHHYGQIPEEQPEGEQIYFSQSLSGILAKQIYNTHTIQKHAHLYDTHICYTHVPHAWPRVLGQDATAIGTCSREGVSFCCEHKALNRQEVPTCKIPPRPSLQWPTSSWSF